jgi:coenzyme F420-dependent glucose-6-phosphate dehydrogenase
MAKIGYALSSEEHPPDALVGFARKAEQAGFDFALISDHYHPWIDRQGQAAFVWAVVGALAQVTERLQIGTGVTCPTIRIHPAIIAQAAATAAVMLPDRFFLGVGTGENLNEHILGDRWPPTEVRREMLAEAVQVMRLLWGGGQQSHRGEHYTVENARIYTLPDEPPAVMVAAGGEKAAKLAGEIGDGFISLSPQNEIVEAFESEGGKGKPCIGQLEVCWAKDEPTARKTAHEWWPTTALAGELNQELALPAHFEQAVQSVREQDVAEKVVCGPDPERHAEGIEKFLDAGYDHVYLHQVGPEQDGFLDFYSREILPRFS